MKKYLSKFIMSFETTLLLTFMVVFFGPSEIFFSNATQFKFLFSEFVFISLGLMLGISLVVSLLIAILPEKVVKYINAIILGIDVAAYFQVMMFNKGLDLLGQNPNGYQVPASRAVINTIIWAVFIAIMIFLVIKKDDIFAKTVKLLPIFLIIVQSTGFISLIAGADESAFKRPEGEWSLSGEEQMVVSSKENVIFIVLDYFSNEYVEPMLEKYPEALDYLHDFTYYTNDDCVYYGTYPSMVHMLTGAHVNDKQTVNDWTKEALTSENGEKIFDTIHKKGYKLNVFTPSSDIYRGSNDITILDGKFDNLSNAVVSVSVDKKLLIKTLSKMSAYRMAPELLKNSFYTNVAEYENIVKELETGRAHNNYDFYNRLLTEGVHTKDDSNYLIIQHLMGDHDRATNADGTQNPNDDSMIEDNSKGCMVVLEEYLKQLKEVGVYDNSTIIITSDHGSETEPQVIFFIKRPGETGDKLKNNNAPINHCDVLPTLIDSIGADATAFGTPVYDYDENMERERMFSVRCHDSNYPDVPFYTGEKTGSENCMYLYIYTGDLYDAKEKIDNGPDGIMTLVDSFF